MAELLDAFKKKTEDVLDSINRSGGLRGTIDSLRRQMAEADRKRAVARARSQLESLKHEVTEMTNAIGLQAIGLYEAGKLSSPELQPLCQHVVSLKAAIFHAEQELEQLTETSGPQEAGKATPVAAAPASEPAGSVAAVPEVTCIKCGATWPASAAFCAFCGNPLAPAQAEGRVVRFCIQCGAALRQGAKYCSKCGTAVVRKP